MVRAWRQCRRPSVGPTSRWRLALTIAAGALRGYNRTEHGKAAGLRTTLLVCLAASVAMILPSP